MEGARSGDVVRYRPGNLHEPMTGTVARRVTPRTFELYGGEWIPADSIVEVLGHLPEKMPKPEILAAAARDGVDALTFAPRTPYRKPSEPRRTTRGPEA